MQKTVVIVLLGCALAVFSRLVAAQHGKSAVPDLSLTRPIAFNIPTEPLVMALPELGRQADLDVTFYADVGKGLIAPALKGTYTVEQALSAILVGTGLKAEFTSPRAVVIRRAAVEAPVKPTAPEGAKPELSSDDSGTKHSREDLDLNTAKLEEVLVTAQKRSERLRDVPVPVTAISADTLVESNQLRLADYYSSIPGLSLTSQGQGAVSVSIRGVTTAGTSSVANPTVGVTVDDVPYGSSTGIGGGVNFPDIDPSDLARIEVLRGPQGTLYGASSLGGEVKFVTIDPSTDTANGRMQADLNRIYGGTPIGYGVRAAINLPLSETVAIRASGFSRRDPGYVDDPVSRESDVNELDAHGGRLSALWRPSDSFSLKLSSVLQSITGHGTSAISVNNLLKPTLGDLQQNLLPGTGGYIQDVRVYSATFDGRIGGTHITAITGFQRNSFNQIADATLGYSSIAEALFGVTGSGAVFDQQTNKFTQEIRWSSEGNKKLDWLIGLFYTHESSPNFYAPYAASAVTGESAGILYTDSYPTKYAESAGFGDLTWHITESFDIQFGGRESRIRQAYRETLTGQGLAFSGLPFQIVQPPVHTKDNAFTYLVTPEWKISSDLMVYSRLASGYRPGGPNPLCTLFDTPCHFKPDKTNNYEVGVKGDGLNHLLSFDASIYYIKWKDIQLSVVNCCTQYLTNATSAKSEGMEVSAEMRPIRGLKVAAWVAFNNAILTGDFPPNAAAYGISGDRLPFSSRFSGSVSADEEFSITSGVSGFFGSSISYVGSRLNDFPPSSASPRFVMPSYTKVDLRIGARYGEVTVSLFANNVADKRGMVGINTVPLSVNYIQPRTIGVSLSRTF